MVQQVNHGVGELSGARPVKHLEIKGRRGSLPAFPSMKITHHHYEGRRGGHALGLPLSDLFFDVAAKDLEYEEVDMAVIRAGSGYLLRDGRVVIHGRLGGKGDIVRHEPGRFGHRPPGIGIRQAGEPEPVLQNGRQLGGELLQHTQLIFAGTEQDFELWRSVAEGKRLPRLELLADMLGQPTPEELPLFGRSRVAELLRLQSKDLFKLVQDEDGGLQSVAAPENGGLEQRPEALGVPGGIVDRLRVIGLLDSGSEDRHRREGRIGVIEPDRHRQKIALVVAWEKADPEQYRLSQAGFGEEHQHVDTEELVQQHAGFLASTSRHVAFVGSLAPWALARACAASSCR
jgi:hypothetical protein